MITIIINIIININTGIYYLLINSGSGDGSSENGGVYFPRWNKINITNIEETAKKRNLLTIETSDSPGLLIKIAKVLHENGTSIYSARINTLGDRVEDTFEIEDMTLSSVSKNKIEKISVSLKETL